MPDALRVHVWRRIPGEERLIGLAPPEAGGAWMATAAVCPGASVAYGDTEDDALGRYLALAMKACGGSLPGAFAARCRIIRTFGGDGAARPLTDDDVRRELAQAGGMHRPRSLSPDGVLSRYP